MRVLFLFFFLFISVSYSSAQRFYGEVTGGIAGSQVSGDLLQGFDKAGIIFGGGVRLPFNNNSSIGVRIQYFQKGSRKPSKLDQGDPSYYLLRLNYLEVPLLYRHSLFKKFYAEAGLSAGFLIGSSEQDEDGEIPLREDFKTLDLSGAFILGYSLSSKLDFGFGVWQSLLPIRPHNGEAKYRLNEGQYNSALSFTLLYNLRNSTSD